MMARQLPLEFPPSADSDFIPSAANARAQARLGALGQGEQVVYILGPAKSGKSSLLRMLDIHPLGVEDMGSFIASNGSGVVAVDDLGAALDAGGAESLFHLFNYARAGRCDLAILDRQPISTYDIALPDLKTRLQSVEVIAIDHPDDDLVHQLITQQFYRAGLTVKPDLVAYLANRLDRNYTAIVDAVAVIDAYARAEGVRANIKSAKAALDIK